jgi:phosphohistidine phosphatase
VLPNAIKALIVIQNRKTALKTLLLIRHAKAAMYGPVPGDHARPLAEKGHRQTRELVRQFSQAGIQIDLALVSSAQRTRETWADVKAGQQSAREQFIEDLYLASAEQIERQIWLASDAEGTLAVIGHNPGLAVQAWNYLQTGQDHDPAAAAKVRGAFKTGFAAQFDLGGKHPRLLRVFDPREC